MPEHNYLPCLPSSRSFHLAFACFLLPEPKPLLRSERIGFPVGFANRHRLLMCFILLQGAAHFSLRCCTQTDFVRRTLEKQLEMKVHDVNSLHGTKATPYASSSFLLGCRHTQSSLCGARLKNSWRRCARRALLCPRMQQQRRLCLDP